VGKDAEKMRDKKIQITGTLEQSKNFNGRLYLRAKTVVLADEPTKELVKKEIEETKKEAKADEESLKKAKTPQERERLERWLQTYKDRLAEKEKMLAKLENKTDPTNKDAAPAPKPSSPTRKTGAAVYDEFPEPLRSKLVKDWEGERDALQRAIEDDKNRLARATTPQEKKKLSDYIATYTEKLAKHMENNPPYRAK
jgi:hypothetical protein